MASGWLLSWPFMGREARFLFQVGCFALKGNGGPGPCGHLQSPQDAPGPRGSMSLVPYHCFSSP